MSTARRYGPSCVSDVDAEFALNCANTHKGATISMIACRPTPNYYQCKIHIIKHLRLIMQLTYSGNVGAKQ